MELFAAVCDFVVLYGLSGCSLLNLCERLTCSFLVVSDYLVICYFWGLGLLFGVWGFVWILGLLRGF